MAVLFGLAGQPLGKRPHRRLGGAKTLSASPIEDRANTLPDPPRRLPLRKPDRDQNLANRRTPDLVHSNVADLGEGVGGQGRKPLILVLAVLSSLFALLVHEFGRITEGWDSLALLLSLGDRVYSLRDLFAHDEG